jgi:hypothetical protein
MMNHATHAHTVRRWRTQTLKTAYPLNGVRQPPTATLRISSSAFVVRHPTNKYQWSLPGTWPLAKGQ